MAKVPRPLLPDSRTVERIARQQRRLDPGGGAGEFESVARSIPYPRGRVLPPNVATVVADPSGRCPPARTGSVGSGAIGYDPDDPESNVVNDSSYNAFPGVTSFGDCALICTYNRRTSHTSSDGVIVVRTSADLGRTWGPRATVFDDPTLDCRDAEINRLTDGRLVVSFFKHNGSTPTDAFVSFSSDNGATWGTPVAVTSSFTDWTACSAKVIETADGALLLPLYGRDSGDSFDSAAVVKSADGGTTWGGFAIVGDGPAASRDFNEPNVCKLADGTLIALIRTDTATVSVFRSVSSDAGATWTSPASVLTAGAGRPTVITLASGGLLCAHRDSSLRTRVSTSWDNGATWSTGPFYSGSEGEYSSLVEVVPGFIVAVHSLQLGTTNADINCTWYADGG